MSRHRAERVARVLLFAVALGPAAFLHAAPSPSLVLITLDTTRSDYVGRIEEGRPVTPNLDRLARSGVRFTRALTASLPAWVEDSGQAV